MNWAYRAAWRAVRNGSAGISARRRGCAAATFVWGWRMSKLEVELSTSPTAHASVARKARVFILTNAHVLYGKLRPYLNKVATPEFAGKCSTELVPLLPRVGVDREFIGYLLRRQKTVDYVMSSVTGARMPRTDMNALLSLPVPLPPLDEQRRIVAVLNRAAKIERLRARAHELMREFIPALFLEMFGDPAENPMRWTTERLGCLIESGPQNGLYKPKSAYGSGTPILRIDGFYDGNVSNPVSWQRLRLDDSTLNKYKLMEDDIIINRVNSRPFLGKSAIIPKIQEPAVFESNMMRMQIDADRLLPQFLISMLQLETIRSSLCSNAKDAINQSSINQTDVRGLLVIVPPLHLQHRYAQTRDAARAILSVAKFGSRTTQKLSAPPPVSAADGRHMTDIVDTKCRSEMMARIRGRNTAPELAVRRIAHRMGLRFRLHRKDLPGRPDLVFPKHRLAVFVHGCFWHRHEGCRHASTPKSRTAFLDREVRSQHRARCAPQRQP